MPFPITDLSTDPPSVQQSSYEDIAWPVDFTAYLTGDQTLAADGATGVLRHKAATITLEDAATVDGNIVTQRIRAGTLTGGESYELVVTAQIEGTTNVLATVTAINCPI